MRYLAWLVVPVLALGALAQSMPLNGQYGGNGGRGGGISYVTRPTPTMNANLIAAAYFRGAGIALGASNGAPSAYSTRAGFAASQPRTSAVPLVALAPALTPAAGAAARAPAWRGGSQPLAASPPTPTFGGVGVTAHPPPTGAPAMRMQAPRPANVALSPWHERLMSLESPGTNSARLPASRLGPRSR
jgi:hypothetical protein